MQPTARLARLAAIASLIPSPMHMASGIAVARARAGVQLKPTVHAIPAVLWSSLGCLFVLSNPAVMYLCVQRSLAQLSVPLFNDTLHTSPAASFPISGAMP